MSLLCPSPYSLDKVSVCMLLPFAAEFVMISTGLITNIINIYWMNIYKWVVFFEKREKSIYELRKLQICQLCMIKSHRISSFIKYSKLRHLHRKSTSSEHIIQGGFICIKVPGTYSYASVFSVLLSVKWALIQSRYSVQSTFRISQNVYRIDLIVPLSKRMSPVLHLRGSASILSSGMGAVM